MIFRIEFTTHSFILKFLDFLCNIIWLGEINAHVISFNIENCLFSFFFSASNDFSDLVYLSFTSFFILFLLSIFSGFLLVQNILQVLRQSFLFNPLKSSLCGCHLFTGNLEDINFLFLTRLFFLLRTFFFIIVALFIFLFFLLFFFTFLRLTALIRVFLSGFLDLFLGLLYFFAWAFLGIILFLLLSLGSLTLIITPHWCLSELINLCLQGIVSWACGLDVFLNFLFQFIQLLTVGLI